MEKNDARDGKGEYHYKNGNRYKGDWNNNKMDGKGTFYYENRDRETGESSNDKKIGKHLYIKADGSEFEIQYG